MEVFKATGFTDIRTYDYYHNDKFHFESTVDTFGHAPLRSIFVLQVSSHEPTGCSPSKDQWLEIAKVAASRLAFIVFDNEYCGIASGDVNQDCWVIRMFANAGFEMFVATGFCASMGFYGERVGHLSLIVKNQEEKSMPVNDYYYGYSSSVNPIRVGILLAYVPIRHNRQRNGMIIKSSYGFPPKHGPTIISTILANREFKNHWSDCLTFISERLCECRILFKNELERVGVPGKFQYLEEQKGLFSMLDISEKQCEFLANKRNLYLLHNGTSAMLNMSVFNSFNVDYIAKSINDSFQLK